MNQTMSAATHIPVYLKRPLRHWQFSPGVAILIAPLGLEGMLPLF